MGGSPGDYIKYVAIPLIGYTLPTRPIQGGNHAAAVPGIPAVRNARVCRVRRLRAAARAAGQYGLRAFQRRGHLAAGQRDGRRQPVATGEEVSLSAR